MNIYPPHTRALHTFYLQVRVVQNKEPPHFYAMFKGKMVVHAGGKASGFKNRADVDSYDKDGTRLFQVTVSQSVYCCSIA